MATIMKPLKPTRRHIKIVSSLWILMILWTLVFRQLFVWHVNLATKSISRVYWLWRYGIYLEKVRQQLDEAGFTDAKIYASNDLDESTILNLKMQRAKIDVWVKIQAHHSLWSACTWCCLQTRLYGRRSGWNARHHQTVQQCRESFHAWQNKSGVSQEKVMVNLREIILLWWWETRPEWGNLHVPSRAHLY